MLFDKIIIILVTYNRIDLLDLLFIVLNNLILITLFEHRGQLWINLKTLWTHRNSFKLIPYFGQFFLRPFELFQKSLHWWNWASFFNQLISFLHHFKVKSFLLVFLLKFKSLTNFKKLQIFDDDLFADCIHDLWIQLWRIHIS